MSAPVKSSNTVFVVDYEKNQIRFNNKKYNVNLNKGGQKRKLEGKDLDRIVKILTKAGLNKPETNLKSTVIHAKKITVENKETPLDEATTTKITKIFTKIVEQTPPKTKNENKAVPEASATKKQPPVANPAPAAPAAKNENSDEASADENGVDNSEVIKKSVAESEKRRQEKKALDAKNAVADFEEDASVSDSEKEKVDDIGLGIRPEIALNFKPLVDGFSKILPDAPVAIRSIVPLDKKVTAQLEIDPIKNPHQIKLRGDGDCGYRAGYIGIVTHLILNNGNEGIKFFLKKLEEADRISGFREIAALLRTDARYELVRLASDEDSTKEELLHKFYELCQNENFDREFSLLIRLIVNFKQITETVDDDQQDILRAKAIFDFSEDHSKMKQEELEKYYAESPRDFIALSEYFGVPFIIRDPSDKTGESGMNYPLEFDATKSPMTDYVMLLGGGNHFDLVLGL